MRSQAVQAPAKSDVGNVNNVALKDVPLRSLFPDEPPKPRPVRALRHRSLVVCIWQAPTAPSCMASSASASSSAARRSPLPCTAAQHGTAPRPSSLRTRLMLTLPRTSQGATKLKVAIVGSGLAGLSTAVELLDQVCALTNPRPCWRCLDAGMRVRAGGVCTPGAACFARQATCGWLGRTSRARAWVLTWVLTWVLAVLQGHEVEIYESRPFIGGKVASYRDKDGNDIEMGLHVFFGAAGD
mgnify:CR=1 FL=1